MMKKLPPIEKIYEAWSALADGRVEEDSGSKAECKAKNTENWTASQGAAYVFSSDGSKVYRVTWKEAVYTSNDNASYWQGYAGYPILAVLMLQKKLPYDPKVAACLGGINWNELNARYKAKYDRAVDEILEGLEGKAEVAAIRLEAENTYRCLANLEILCRRSAWRPPSSALK